MTKIKEEKLALATCSGMSPYGLVARTACSDIVDESDNLISICMGATSADREGFRELIKKYPIIAVNGCESSCVNKILNQKGVKVRETINTQEILQKTDLRPSNVSRLDEEGEKSVNLIKSNTRKKIKSIKGKDKVLLICKNNSARSQMAEGLLKHFYGEYYDVYSAGSIPTKVNPLAIEVMAEIGIDISKNESSSLEKFSAKDFDYVITLCDEGSCPVFLGGKNFIHHGFQDPTIITGTKEDKLVLFRLVRDEIKEWIIKQFIREE